MPMIEKAMQNGEVPNYPEPLYRAVKAAEQAVADAVANIQHHTEALERERMELARHEAVLAAYTHAVTLLTESGFAAPTEPAKIRRPRRDIVGMVREYVDQRPDDRFSDEKKPGPIAEALGIRLSQAANALIKINQEKARAEIPT